MILHVVSYRLESAGEPEHECFFNVRSARVRLRELEADEAAHHDEDEMYFALRPEVHRIEIPCNATGIVDAIEGRWLKYARHEVVL